MKGFAHALLLSAVVVTLLTRAHSLDVFLTNITIYRDHEPNIPFTKNHPEVYLSCNDGRPKIELKHVDDEHRVYDFYLGEVLVTAVEEDGACVDCRLKESDSGILEDDTFGDFSLCRHQFTETGDYIAFVPGQFRMGFRCPDCLVIPNPEPVPEPEIEQEQEILPPAPEPEDDLEEGFYEYQIIAAEPSIEATEEDTQEDDPIGQYYFAPAGTFSVENGDDQVGLQSEGGEQREVQTASSDGLSTATVLSLCFVFLVVGVGIGVVVFRKYSAHVANQREAAAAFELSKIGIMKKGKL